MKPQKGPDIQRTQNDTDPISLICKIHTDAGKVVVPDTATVTLHVSGPTTQAITGTPKGDSSGTFLFNPATIKAWPQGKYDYEVQVDDGSDIKTIGYGRIRQRNEIA